MPDTAYDVIPYPDYPFEQTQPGRLAAMAVLHGLEAPDVATARVLELGCGGGANALAIAAAWPGAQVVGIDLAARPIADATQTARAAGVDNATFLAADVCDPPADLGTFDYVIAHGLYAWVPPAVRDAAMALIGRVLSPDGVAVVSYNARPGAELARALRDAALWHVRDVEDPLERAGRARELFWVLEDARAKAGSKAWDGALAEVVRDLAGGSPQVISHDILSDAWDPVWFADFAAHAGRHGLRYVDEAWPRRPRPAAVDALLDGLGAAGRIEHEQYADILLCRRFRASVLCRAGRAVADRVDPRAICGLRVAAGDPPAGLDGEALAVAEAVHAAVPLAVRVGDLPGGPEAVWTAVAAGALIPWAAPIPVVPEPGERPEAHRLARRQAALGRPLTTLKGSFVTVDDPASRALLTLLDGTRDRPAIVAGMRERAGVDVPPEALEPNLRALAGLGLLVA